MDRAGRPKNSGQGCFILADERLLLFEFRCDVISHLDLLVAELHGLAACHPRDVADRLVYVLQAVRTILREPANLAREGGVRA
jgi:hypothetical protein